MKRVIIASSVENMPTKLYSDLDWFISDLGSPLKPTDLTTLDSMWNKVNQNTKREIKGFVSKVKTTCDKENMSIDDAYDSYEEVADNVEDLVTIIRGITRRQDSKYMN